MNRTQLLRGTLGLTGLALLLSACGADGTGGGADTPASCNGLDAKVEAQATLKAFAAATANLKSSAGKAEAQFKTVCNKMNAELGLEEGADAASACATLKARVDSAISGGARVEVTIDPPSCQADLSVKANCDASCAVEGGCDVEASCDPGDLVVECNGGCSGSCEVSAPEFACSGTCEGSCTAEVEASCQGECQGSCDAPSFEGTCDAGCTAGFTGSCDGTCNGTCDGSTSDGAACAGECQGSCEGTATGSCEAKCEGNFTGGSCEGTCSGSCVTRGEVACTGTCNGTCTLEPGSAKCEGECHGSCDAEVSPPTCEGELDCDVNAECRASCDAQASASVECVEPGASVTVVGDAELLTTLRAHIREFGAAVNLTLALRDPVADVASKGLATFEGIGDIGLAGAACFASSAQAAVDAQASISVSVSASASISGSAGN